MSIDACLKVIDHCSPNEAGAKAVSWAVDLAKSRGWSKFIIEGDAARVLGPLMNHSCCPNGLLNILFFTYVFLC